MSSFTEIPLEKPPTVVTVAKHASSVTVSLSTSVFGATTLVEASTVSYCIDLTLNNTLPGF